MNILDQVQSICPQCHKPIDAQYVAEKGTVYLTKNCPQHGSWKTVIAEEQRDYIHWMRQKVVNIPPKKPLTQGSKNPQCPLDCGTCTNHLQTACCVLVDVTQRCNQHCPYCFARADEGVEDEPTLGEIEKKYDVLLELGEERPFNLQISGGEPTVREDLPEIIALAKKKGFPYIQLNSNGKRIGMQPGYAKQLKKAGLSAVFMQYDGTTDEIHQKLRNENLKEIKEKAIEECRKARLPVTLVPMVVRGVNLDNLGEMMQFLLDHVDVVKGIHFQPVSYFGRYPEDQNRVTMFDVLHQLEEQTHWFSYKDFAPITSGHPLCCFYSTYAKEGDRVVCQLGSKQKEEGIQCCDTKGGDEALSCGCRCDWEASQAEGFHRLEAIGKTRNYVLNQWNVCEEEEKISFDQTMDLDQFIKYYQQNSFTVTGMAFQDVQNMDGERMKRCRVMQLTEDNRLIPFCAYNSIYRGGKDA